MAEVGRAAVRDPGALLPGGFWAAVAVWLERPQVANKRLCGVRLDSRRSAVLPRTEARGPTSSAGPEQEERAAARCGPEEGPGPGPNADLEQPQGRRQEAEERREAAAAPLRAGPPGQPGRAGVGEDDFPASDLDSLWDDFSRSLVGDDQDMLAFLAGSGAGSRPGAPRELDVVLRTVIPKGSPHCPLSAPTREIVLQGKGIANSGRCSRQTKPGPG